MKRFLLLSLFFMCLYILHGYTETYQHEFRELTPLEKEAFDTLKKEFPGELLDAELKTLNELAKSTEYKNFLGKAHPNASLPPEFAEVANADGQIVDGTLYKILPPKERYLTYYTEQFGVQTLDEITTLEHFIVHYEETGKWIFRAVKRGGDTPEYLRTKGPQRGGPLGRSSAFQAMMKHRFGIEIKEKPDMSNIPQIMQVFDFPLTGLTFELMDADVHWIQSLFDKYGKSEGILWIALQNLGIFNRILYAFTTDKTFLKFISEPSE